MRVNTVSNDTVVHFATIYVIRTEKSYDTRIPVVEL
jgi:hypothetical protein